MYYIQKLFLLEKIYFKQTIIQILIIYAFIIPLLLFLAIVWVPASYMEALSYLYVLGVIIYAYLFVRTVIRNIIVNLKLRKLTKSSNLTAYHDNKTLSINNELDKIDETRIIAQDENSKLYYAIFNFYRHTDYGDYLSKQVYYTVLEIKLIRQLPHILFDSKKAKRQQFKYLYLNSQRISVQGHFDDYFDTYVPQTYHIDSLGFITPEVMEALIDASEYDIEIIGDKVVMYGPVTDKKAIAELQQKGMSLATHLNDNIDTYKDNRLSGSDRHSKVTVFGRSLLKSPTKYMAIAALMVLPIIGIIYLSITFHSQILFTEVSLIIYLTFVVNVYKAIKIKRQNNKSLKQFYYLHHTNRGQPIK